MASCRVNVGDLISDEPLDLSMKNNRHEKENLERGPLVMQSNTPQQTNVVVARLWQTSVVMRFQESPQQLEKVNEQPTHHRSQESQLQVLQQVEKVEERQLNCIRTPTLPQRKKRFRFTGQQINFMEQIFEIKQLQLTAVEFLETARLLNVNELLVSGSFYFHVFLNVK